MIAPAPHEPAAPGGLPAEGPGLDWGPLDEILHEYQGQRGAVIPILQRAQDAYGYLPKELLARIAKRTVIPVSRLTGEDWICLHPLRDRGQKPFIATQWPWGVTVFTQRKPQMPARHELAVGALQQAVTMAKAGEAEAYDIGFKAWESCIERLKAMDTADDRTRSEALLGNSWIYECLASYRASAAVYLRQIANEFETQVAAHLSRAADFYERISGTVLRDEGHPTTSIAPYPGGPEDGKLWTNEARHEQVRRLEAPLPLEHEAIGEIEMALSRRKNLPDSPG